MGCVGGFVGLTVLSALLCGTGCRKKAVSTTADALRLILKYNQQGKHDQAIDVALNWLRVEPNDVDVHATVALIYLEKAETDSGHRNELVDEALRHANSALKLAPDSLRVLSPGVSAFERGGDLSTTNRCNEYETALQLIDRETGIETAYSKKQPETPGVKWDQVIMMDKAKYSRIKEKMLKMGCK
jgi:tetratricopeptide (TPR) repeat protein